MITISLEKELFHNVVLRTAEQAAPLVATQQRSYDRAPL
jgi:hypothetical protein